MAGRARLAVVTAPFASARRPSLQVGLLTALARDRGWTVEPMHLNVEFAALVGSERYEALCQHRGTMLAEWLFSAVAFDGDLDRAGDLLDDAEFGTTQQALGLEPEDARAWLRRVHATVVPAFVDAVVTGTDWSRFDLVGFTSTFQQNVASIALARAIKAAHPRTRTLFGGANFDGRMGLEFVRALDVVDLAAIGEADRSFPALLDAVAAGRSPASVPGIASRSEDGTVAFVAEKEPFSDLDGLPVPDYDDYFHRAERHGLLERHGRTAVDLPFESSRGCWWGQKHHCIFCGLNSATMAFRSKSPTRVLEEITTLSQRYRSLSLEAVDNIMENSFTTTLLPEVAARGYDWNIFYEIKANITGRKLGELRRAGVRRLQPGIESLSTRLLATMRKGTTGISNVNFLKWSRHHDLVVSWNLLWGFPGETADDYEVQLATLRLIPHLQPPDGEGRLWLERFSPMFVERSAFGIRDVRPLDTYRFVYPSSVDLDAAAYFFEYQLDGALPDSFFDGVRKEVEHWRAEWESSERPYLTSRTGPGFVEVSEGRPGQDRGIYVLDGFLGEVYQALQERPVTAPVVAGRTGLSAEQVDGAVDAFVGRGLVLREGAKVVALAVPQ